MLTLGVLFLTGALMDVLWVLAVRCATRCEAGKATALNFVLGLLCYGSIWTYFQGPAFLGAAAYATGCAVGTWVTLSRKSDRV